MMNGPGLNTKGTRKAWPVKPVLYTKVTKVTKGHLVKADVYGLARGMAVLVVS